MNLDIAPAPTDGLPSPSDVQVPDTSVVALLVTAGGLRHELHTGLMGTMIYDQQQGFDNYRGELIHTSGANISKARNEIIRRFLVETDAEWAWLLDSDMVIKPDTLPRLLCSAAVSGAKVMGGLCCMVGDDGPIPTTFQLGDPAKGEVTRVMLDYQDNTVLQVAGTGMACLLIHRSVLEHFRDLDPSSNYPWVAEAEITGQWVSEDVLFTLRCNQAGFPVFVDCSTEIGHVKGNKTWWPSDIRKGRGFPDPKTYAIIPTLDNRADLDPLLVQLREQGVTKTVILNNGSGTNWPADVHVIEMPDAGIHEMWNTGIDWAIKDADQRRNVNLLILNDDLRLGPRFVTRLVEALRSEQGLVAVSGNYDGRDGPLVQHVTDICAGRYDGSGGFAGFAFAVKGEWMSSGYRFPEECKWWFGDNDLIMAAHASGVGSIGIAIDAHVEHLDGGSKTGGDFTKFGDQAEKDRLAFIARWEAFNNPPPVPKIAVVTSIYGGYDTPTTFPPLQMVADCILVTDSDEPPPAPWRAVHRHSDLDPRYAGKAAKYEPWLFTDAEYVIWVDGRVQPCTSEFAAWLLSQLGTADVALWRHPMRTTILSEAEACLVENPAKYAGCPVVEQAKSYIAAGLVDDRLWQTTIIAMRVNDRTRLMGEVWTRELEKWPDCLLDQIPFPVAVAESGVQVVDLPGGFWDRHGSLFVLKPHIDGT